MIKTIKQIQINLKQKPFSLVQTEKEKIFLPTVKEMAKWHYNNCPEFKKICDNKQFSVFSSFNLEDLPYLPVTVFKDFDLLSVPKSDIVKTLYSSSTTGTPSKIMLDKITIDNQAMALNSIMSNFFGIERKNFIIFDTEETIKSVDGELSSRGVAIRGMLPMAKKISFILDQNLNLNIEKLKLAVDQLKEGDNFCYFGFTWLVYNIYLKNKDNPKILDIFQKISSKNGSLLHIGGWKKLKDISVSKDTFNKQVAGMLNLKQGRIFDFYGITEQLGTVYPDCENGYKHVPFYSEIIIRDFNTLKPTDIGQIGFIQFISPIPHSYPGISLLSDDIGKIVGIDDCKCGRKGKYFVFEKRSEKAELRGCGDTLKI